MSNEKDMISIDQLFADKMNEGKVDIDPNMAWDQFQTQGAGSSFWTLGKIISLSCLAVTLVVGVMIVNNENLNRDEDSISIQTQSSIEKGINKNIIVSEQQDNSNTVTELDSTNDNLESPIRSNTSTALSQSKNFDELGKVNQSIKENTIKTSNALATNVTATKSQSNSRSQTQDLNKVSISDKNNRIKAKSSSSNTQEKLIINTTTTSNNSLSEANTSQSDNIISNNSASTLELNKDKEIGKLDLLSTAPSYIDWTNDVSISPIFVDPVSLSTSSGRWYVDLGFSMGKKYELGQDFTLVEKDNRVRPTYLALGREHLSNERLKTRVHLAYSKIYGSPEFIGQRIVRTYSDNNFSIGYNLDLHLFRSVDLEIGSGVGLSLINKTEYEQKPFWLDGVQQYKDYSQTVFKIDPTLSYQATCRVLIEMPYRFQLMGGAIYRSQFVNKLSSQQTIRENTLDKFMDLQFQLGLRYKI